MVTGPAGSIESPPGTPVPLAGTPEPEHESDYRSSARAMITRWRMTRSSLSRSALRIFVLR